MSEALESYLDGLLKVPAAAAPPGAPCPGPAGHPLPQAGEGSAGQPAAVFARPRPRVGQPRPSTESSCPARGARNDTHQSAESSSPPPAGERQREGGPDANAAKPDRWLIFHLAGQHYALAVSALQEVLAWHAPTRVPCAPPNVLGLIHRRGSVVPVVDIRQALGLPVGAPTPHGAMVLLPQALALAVDAIGDVFVPGDDRQPPPSVGTPAPAISALSHHAGKRVVLLDGAALAKAAAMRPGTALA